MQALERIREVLEMIVCPACHGRLELHSIAQTAHATGNPSAEESFIRCVECRKSYPIEDGIPVLLVERATPEH
jgi:uncharacterized protein YbaR (Trm112 family)